MRYKLPQSPNTPTSPRPRPLTADCNHALLLEPAVQGARRLPVAVLLGVVPDNQGCRVDTTALKRGREVKFTHLEYTGMVGGGGGGGGVYNPEERAGHNSSSNCDLIFEAPPTDFAHKGTYMYKSLCWRTLRELFFLPP